MSQEKIAFEISRDEALVLFEFLSRFSEKGALSIEDTAEERVLWNLVAILEKSLPEPFRADYIEILESARASLRDKQD